jgi:phage terminase Nu1 subunit (DNA packaging protein)
LIVSQLEISKILGVSPSAIRKWIANQGFPVVKHSNGLSAVEIETVDAIAWHVKRQLDAELGVLQAKLAKYEGAGGAVAATLNEENIRLTAAKRRLAELELDEKEGLLAPVAAFEASITEALGVISARDDEIAGKLAGQLVGETNAAAIKQSILAELRNNRAEAADRLENWAGMGAQSQRTAAAAEQISGSVGG